jgi:Putative Phosphatase
MQERVLAVWDFDWTLVEDNSDTWVVEQLGAKADFLRLQQVRGLVAQIMVLWIHPPSTTGQPNTLGSAVCGQPE